jgi:predicted aconitase
VNRRGTHRVQLDVAVESTADWGMLGYWLGHHHARQQEG